MLFSSQTIICKKDIKDYRIENLYDATEYDFFNQILTDHMNKFTFFTKFNDVVKYIRIE